jgi:hypothetical protein
MKTREECEKWLHKITTESREAIPLGPPYVFRGDADEILAAIAEAKRMERERCAKIAENHDHEMTLDPDRDSSSCECQTVIGKQIRRDATPAVAEEKGECPKGGEHHFVNADEVLCEKCGEKP